MDYENDNIDTKEWSKPLEIVDYNDLSVGRDSFLLQESDYKDFLLLWRYYLEDPNTRTPHPHNFIPVRIASVEKIEPNFLEINLCVDQSIRYHSSIVNLPKSSFVTCVANWNYQKQQVIVVKDEWMSRFMSNCFSVFCFIDAIGVKNQIQKNGELSLKDIKAFKRNIDKVSGKFPDLVFLSFGDTVVISASFSSSRSYYYQYSPERIMVAASHVRKAFQEKLNLGSYVIMSQGYLLDHGKFSKKRFSVGTHLSFNSLGTPFSRLFEIDEIARRYSKEKVHPPSSLYVDERLWWAINLVDKAKDTYKDSCVGYESKTSGNHEKYYWTDFDTVFQLLEFNRSKEIYKLFRFRLSFFLKMKWDRLWHTVKVKKSLKAQKMKETLEGYNLKY